MSNINVYYKDIIAVKMYLYMHMYAHTQKWLFFSESCEVEI